MSVASMDLYRHALAAGGLTVREPEPDFGGAGEMELQARWFAGEFGREWTTVDGARVEIEDFGQWNHEAGPDFVNVRLLLGGVERRGAMEIDLDVRDWERHGHATNPAFRETVAHVFVHRPAEKFFTRTCDHREVAQIQLVAPANRGVASPAIEAAITDDAFRARAILEAAARHRLDLKATALCKYAAVHGEDDAWFAALAVALGYKRNQTPFLLLAQRVALRAAVRSGGEARLFGVAGFLEAPQPPAADRDVRAYLRDLWESWWAERARCERWILPPTAWQFHGSRPANHPHRRVAALATIATAWSTIRAALAQARRDDFLAALEAREHPFWAARFNLQSARLARPQALIGAERLRDILLNIFHPLAVARDESAWADFLAERGPAPAAIMRAAAQRFFDGAVAGELSRAVIQQGLLQIERDHRSAPDPRAFLGALREGNFPAPSEGSTPRHSRG
jgi:hypothetical protein